MNDPGSPTAAELAEKLFAAGRAEEPGLALGRRLSLIHPASRERRATKASMQAAQRSSSESKAVPSVTSLFTPARAALGLCATMAVAAMAAATLGHWLPLEAKMSKVSLTAERVSHREQRENAPPSSAPPAPATAAPEATLAVDAQRAAVGSGGSTASIEVGKPAAPARASRQRFAQPSSGPSRRAPPALEAPAPPGSSALPSSALPSSALPSNAPSSSLLPSPTSRPTSLKAELELLKSARAALRAGDARQASQLLDRHDRGRSENGLIAEATLLRIETLAALGRDAEASSMALRFLRDNPNSALADRAKSFVRHPAER